MKRVVIGALSIAFCAPLWASTGKKTTHYHAKSNTAFHQVNKLLLLSLGDEATAVDQLSESIDGVITDTLLPKFTDILASTTLIADIIDTLTTSTSVSLQELEDKLLDLDDVLTATLIPKLCTSLDSATTAESILSVTALMESLENVQMLITQTVLEKTCAIFEDLGCPPTPIFTQTIITQPGNYILTKNIPEKEVVILDPFDGTALFIQADNVTIDMNGFAVGDPEGNDNVIQVGVGAIEPRNVVIKNGTVIAGFGQGLSAPGVEHLIIENMSFDVETTAISVAGYDIKIRNVLATARDSVGNTANVIDVQQVSDGFLERVTIKHEDAANNQTGIGIFESENIILSQCHVFSCTTGFQVNQIFPFSEQSMCFLKCSAINCGTGFNIITDGNGSGELVEIMVKECKALGNSSCGFNLDVTQAGTLFMANLAVSNLMNYCQGMVATTPGMPPYYEVTSLVNAAYPDNISL